MSYNHPDHIDVTAKGSAETEFTSATYRATVVTSGKTGPQAKEKALPIIEKIRAAVLKHGTSAGLDTGRMKTTFGVDVETHRQTGEFIGYRATYTAEFKGTNIREAPAVHDALTSIEGVQSGTPVYHVNDGVEVHAKAFADAVGKAKAKFSAQCKGLGIDPEYFEVLSWTIQEDMPRGKTLSFQANATEPKAVGLEPGKATLDLNVTFVFGPVRGATGIVHLNKKPSP
jgi:uncharacterized protein YggE